MSRRLLVAGNWKMHGSLAMTAELISGIAQSVKASGESTLNYDVLICPPAIYLAAAKVAIVANAQGLPIYLGAQNVHAAASGAFTGELALPMLSDIGCSHVLLGHSERRELFAESDVEIAEKFVACVKHEPRITPVLCVGETLAQRQAGETEAVVLRQLEAVLQKVTIADFARAVIAYEPVWAIGTGETASPSQAQEVHAFIRGSLRQLDVNIAEQICILYGGSVKPGNALELFAQPDIDGGLIGGAALDVDSFAGICAAAAELAA